MTRVDMRYGAGIPRHSKCKGPEVAQNLALRCSPMPYYLPRPALGTRDTKADEIPRLFSGSSQHMEYVGEKHTARSVGGGPFECPVVSSVVAALERRCFIHLPGIGGDLLSVTKRGAGTQKSPWSLGDPDFPLGLFSTGQMTSWWHFSLDTET